MVRPQGLSFLICLTINARSKVLLGWHSRPRSPYTDEASFGVCLVNHTRYELLLNVGTLFLAALTQIKPPYGVCLVNYTRYKLLLNVGTLFLAALTQIKPPYGVCLVNHTRYELLSNVGTLFLAALTQIKHPLVFA
jgi:hypothetical protein